MSNWDDRELRENLEEYINRIHEAVVVVAQFIAATLQADAQAKARWIDRTGNARSGLLAFVDASQNIVKIYLTTQMEYGAALELDHGGKYAAIMPTIQQAMPEIKKLLEDIFK